MTVNLLSSEKEFEDYCLGAFKSMLHGEMFPYSLRGTYYLVFNSWDDAVNELQENGAEGYSYQENPEDDDYLLSLHGFTQHIVMQDKTLELLARFCDTTYRQQMAIFDIPVRFETRCEKKADGKSRIVQIPINDIMPKGLNNHHEGFASSCGDLYAKTCFDKFLQESGFSVNTATVAAAYGMPEEGLLCTLKQNDIIIENDDDAGEYVFNLANDLCEGNDPIGLTHIREGVVVRIVNSPKFKAYKHKGFNFKVIEGIIKENAEEPDIEDLKVV